MFCNKLFYVSSFSHNLGDKLLHVSQFFESQIKDKYLGLGHF